MKKTGMIWRRGVFISMLAAAGMVWMSGEKAESAVEPQVVNQEAVIYLDGMDKISVEGEGIQAVSYTSSKKKVAKIDKNGKITPKKKGKTRIQAKVTYQAAGQSSTKTLSYDLQVMGKSTEYFKYHSKGKKYSRISGLTKKGKKLKKVYLPGFCKGKKILYVDARTFYKDTALEKLYCSDNLEYLDYYNWTEGYDPTQNFMGCSNLKELHLGKNLKGVGYQRNTSSLEKITIDERNTNFYVKDNVLFSNKGELISYPRGRKDGEYKIPDEVNTLGVYAFSGAKNLKKVQFPERIIDMSLAFENCGLTEVTVPESVDNFYGAFLDCGALEKAVVETKAQDSRAFEGCKKLKTVVISGAMSGSNFSGCQSLENIQLSPKAADVIVEDGVLYSGDRKQLLIYPAGKKAKSYTLPAGTQEITESSFSGAQFLSQLVLNEGLKRIEANAFTNLKLVEINIPDSVTTLGVGAFSNCNKLQSVKLSKNIEEMPCYLFNGCTALKKIHIPAKVKKIGVNDDFYLDYYTLVTGCKNLTAYTVDKENKYFTAVNGVLYNKSKKILYSYPAKKKGKKFVMPKSVTKILGNAFLDNYYLQEISMKDKVTLCGSEVFKNAKSLKKVRFSKKMDSIGMMAFEGCKKLNKIIIPDSVTSIGFSAFNGCTSLKEVTIGKKVESLYYSTFKNCKNLRKLVFRGKKRAMYYSGSLSLEEDTFIKTGSKNYRKLVVKIRCSKKNERKQIKEEFYKAGLSKKSKIVFVK